MAESFVTVMLAFSLWAYVVTGGADFGVGILECFAPRAERSQLRKAGERAIAPVWEANHVWVIVALVILFVGFPMIHVQLVTTLHVPMLLMLVGIVLRGTAFTFRYYDVIPDANTTRLWNVLFRAGSVLVPLVFGHLVAAMSRGQMRATPTTVWGSYFAPWLGAFPLAVGVFVVCLFAWLAAVFLVSETTEEKLPAARRRGRRWTLAMLVAGVLVTIAGLWEQVPWLVLEFVPSILGVSLVAGTAGVALVWRELRFANTPPHGWTIRVVAALVAAAILSGYWGAEYPTAVELADAPALTWHGSAAPQATFEALAWALLLAACLILPGLAWLYRLFKTQAVQP